MKSLPQIASVSFFEAYDRIDELVTFSGEYAVEEDQNTIQNHFLFAERLFPDKCLTLCPVSHSKVKYFSANCEHILGISNKDLMNMSIQDFFSLVHADDLTPLSQCFQFMKSLMPFDPTRYRFNIFFRKRNKDNSYSHICCEQLAIQSSEGRYLYLMLFTNKTEEEKFYQVRMDIHKNIRGAFIKSYTYKPKGQMQEMTPRQQDIASMIVKGFTNQEIANRLNLSIYTIKNHKQALFKKLSVKNSISLSNYIMKQEEVEKI